MALEGPARPTEVSELEALYSCDGNRHRWTLSETELEIEIGAFILGRLGYDLAGARRRAGDTIQEIGGLLLGRHDAERNLIRIESADVYSAASLHDVLRVVKDRVNDSAGVAVMGWFRIHPAGPVVHRADESLMCTHFAEPHQVMLLVEPSIETDSQVQFLYWSGKTHLCSETGTFPALPATASDSRPVLRDMEFPEKRRHWWPIRHWPAVLTVSLLAAGAVFWYQNTPKPPLPEAAQTKREQESTETNLFAVQERNLVRIVWNPRSHEILAARSGSLTIVDGSKRVQVALDAMRLSAGLYWYSPSATHVRVTMNIAGLNEESVDRTAEVAVKLTPLAPAPPPDKETVPVHPRIPPLPSPVLPPRAVPPRQRPPALPGPTGPANRFVH